MTSTLRSDEEMWQPVARLLIDERSDLLDMLSTFPKDLAEDALQEVSAKAYIMVRQARTPEAQAEVSRQLANRGFWRRMLRNKAIDLTRQYQKDQRHVEWTEAEQQPPKLRKQLGLPDFSDDVIQEIDREDTAGAVGALAAALIARSTERPARSVRITRQEWITFSKAAALAGEHGNQSAIAEELGLARSTVSERLRRVRQALQLTHYVVGVLGAARFTDEELVDGQLDAFEAFGHTQPKHRIRLEGACPHVLTTPTTGTRVSVDKYTASRPDEPDAVGQLHAAESSWATAVRNPHPNCVTICQPHNPRPDRKTEFSNVR